MTIAEQLRHKGRQEAQREMARNMLAIGIEPMTIMQVTGLTAAELDQIRH